MAQQTAVEFVFEHIQKIHKMDWDILFLQAKQMERQQISDAMMYALDEDGHTGDWKIKFINEYYESNFGVRPE